MSPHPPQPSAPHWIDPRGQRFGAALSAIALIIAIVTASWWLAALVGVALATSAALGTRWFVFGRPWPLIRRVLRLGPAQPEHEYPPRFAQALGASCLALATLLLATGATPWGWLPVAGVIGLQLVLASTGYCLGCRLYFVRWYVPGLFARLIRRGTPT